MNILPKRKKIRMESFDYSSSCAYFLTICSKDREPIFWKKQYLKNVGADTIRPYDRLSEIGQVVDKAINQISEHYSNVVVDKYAIMPDHIHIIIFLLPDDDGRMISAPTVSVIVGQMKRWVSKVVGHTVWQKSFIDRVIRNETGYRAAWNYIESNPYVFDEKQ